MPVTVRAENDNDVQAIWHVNQAAFGGEDEARLVDQLRAGGFVRLSLVAELDGQVVGHILFSELKIVSSDSSLDAVALAPLAVLPAFQRQGIGKLLTQHGLDACQKQGERVAIVLGHPHFYPQFGFSAELAAPLDSPFAGEAFMALEFEPGALAGCTGQVRYAPPFGVFS